jgi:hypothetical protein
MPGTTKALYRGGAGEPMRIPSPSAATSPREHTALPNAVTPPARLVSPRSQDEIAARHAAAVPRHERVGRNLPLRERSLDH